MTFPSLLDGIGLSQKLYRNSLLDLYGEGFAYALLFISITLLIKKIQKVEWGLLAFFLLAITISIRPNLAVFVGILCLSHLLRPTFSEGLWPSRFIMLFGLIPVLLIPLHNILGGEFVLLTKAAQIPENLPLTPRHYFQALSHVFGMTEASDCTSRLSSHFQNVYLQYIMAWLGCLWLSFKEQNPLIRSLALATLGGLSMHIFYLPDIRYMHPYLTIAIVLGLYQVPKFRDPSSNTVLS